MKISFFGRNSHLWGGGGSTGPALSQYVTVHMLFCFRQPLGSCSTHGSWVGQVVQHAKRSGWHVMGSRQFRCMHLEVTSYCFICVGFQFEGVSLFLLFFSI